MTINSQKDAMSRNLFIASGIFHPESGGPATYLYEILPHLQMLGWEIRLLSYGEGDNQSYPYPVQRIRRQALPLRLWHYAKAARPLLNWADLIYSHSIDLPLWGKKHAPHIAKVVGDVAWERSIRRGWIPATTDVDHFQMGDYGLMAKWQKVSRSQQICAYDGIIVPSHYLKQMVIGWGAKPESVHVIYNALPPQDSELSISQVEARERLGIPISMPMLLTVARLNPWKGIDHILNALQQLPDLHLYIAGDGPERPRLEALAKNLGKRVVFLGNIKRQEVHLYLLAADYLILYSGYEGLSHTLLESLRAGTPVIASAKGGNPEVVRHGFNGFLVPYVDVTALTETLRMAFEAQMREKLAMNHHFGMERFTFSTMVSETNRVLLSFLH